MSQTDRLAMVYRDHPHYSIAQQCKFLKVSRSSLYYKPKPVDDTELALMRRLMQRMGIEAIYQKPDTSRKHPEHKVYPYLLKDLDIIHANQVWCADITYIPMAKGFLYLVAVMDWFSRGVLAWRLSCGMETEFCVEALREALARHEAPEVFNTDQGVQFTASAFIERWRRRAFRSAWMAKAVFWITSLSSACGVA